MKLWLLQLCLVLFFSFLSKGETKECGKPNNIFDRIVNGRTVGYMKYPWFASLLLRPMKDRLMCGGTLIGSRYVLTAAHCFKPFFSSIDAGKIQMKDLYHIRMGVSNICDPNEKTQETFATTKVWIHEKYREEMPYYDIALMELDQDANFTHVCLPQRSYNDKDFPPTAIIIGLGKESSHAWRLPCEVKEATINIYDNVTCAKMLESQQEDSSKLHNAFCAGYLEGGIDTCQGDSGGPLQIFNETTGLYELNGVTSFGFGCAARGVLGVYTDVSKYLDWINDKIAPAPKKTEPEFNLDEFWREQEEKLNKSKQYPIDDFTVNIASASPTNVSTATEKISTSTKPAASSSTEPATSTTSSTSSTNSPPPSSTTLSPSSTTLSPSSTTLSPSSTTVSPSSTTLSPSSTTLSSSSAPAVPSTQESTTFQPTTSRVVHHYYKRRRGHKRHRDQLNDLINL